jgi:hypothetical protein
MITEKICAQSLMLGGSENAGKNKNVAAGGLQGMLTSRTGQA